MNSSTAAGAASRGAEDRDRAGVCTPAVRTRQLRYSWLILCLSPELNRAGREEESRSRKRHDTNRRYKRIASRYSDRGSRRHEHENTLAPREPEREAAAVRCSPLEAPWCGMRASHRCINCSRYHDRGPHHFRQPGAGMVVSLIVPAAARAPVRAGVTHPALALKGLHRRSSPHNAVVEGP